RLMRVDDAARLERGAQVLLVEPRVAARAGETPHVDESGDRVLGEQREELLGGAVGVPDRERAHLKQVTGGRGSGAAPDQTQQRPADSAGRCCIVAAGISWPGPAPPRSGWARCARAPRC